MENEYTIDDAFLSNKKKNADNKKEEIWDKCSNCPLDSTDCPGGMWCTVED